MTSDTCHSVALRGQVFGCVTLIYVWQFAPPGDTRGETMAKKKVQGPDDEPMGIVISRGAEKDALPTVLAFVWGSADLELPEFAAA